MLFPNPFDFGALMMVGLFLSLCRLNFFLAWLLTWFAAFLVPTLLGLTLQLFAGIPTRSAVALVSAFDVALMVLMWFQLQRNLRRRTFLRAAPALT